MVNNYTSIGCSPIRPNFGQQDSNTKAKKTVDFDKAADVLSTIDINNMDEAQARNIAKLADAINETEKNEKYTKPLKSFITTVSLALAGGVVAKGTASKILLSVEKNVPVLDFVSKELTRYGQGLKIIKPSDARTFKGFVSRTANATVNWIKNFASKGIKETEIADFVKKNAKNVNDAAEKAFLETAALTQNGVKKAVGYIAGASSAIGVIGQTTKDKNKDGIPDMYQGKDAKQDQLKEKLIDAALETLTS